MSDQNPPQATTDPTPDPAAEESRPPGRLSRWRQAARDRDRAGRTRTGVALAVAGALLLGGAGGFGLGAVAFHGGGPGDRAGWSDHSGDHPSRLDDDRQAPPPGVPGELPPATRDDESGLNG